MIASLAKSYENGLPSGMVWAIGKSALKTGAYARLWKNLTLREATYNGALAASASLIDSALTPLIHANNYPRASSLVRGTIVVGILYSCGVQTMLVNLVAVNILPTLSIKNPTSYLEHSFNLLVQAIQGASIFSSPQKTLTYIAAAGVASVATSLSYVLLYLLGEKATSLANSKPVDPVSYPVLVGVFLFLLLSYCQRQDQYTSLVGELATVVQFVVGPTILRQVFNAYTIGGQAAPHSQPDAGGAHATEGEAAPPPESSAGDAHATEGQAALHSQSDTEDAEESAPPTASSWFVF